MAIQSDLYVSYGWDRMLWKSQETEEIGRPWKRAVPTPFPSSVARRLWVAGRDGGDAQGHTALPAQKFPAGSSTVRGLMVLPPQPLKGEVRASLGLGI